LGRLDWYSIENDVVENLVIHREMKSQPNDYGADANSYRSFLDFHHLRNDEESTSSDNDDY